jgi:hypothetical protein
VAAGSEEVGGSTAKILLFLLRAQEGRMCKLFVLHRPVEDTACSLRLLDLFSVSIRYESSFDREGPQSTIDCAALEGLLPRSMEATAGSASSGVDEEGVKRLLGILDLKTDRVIAGLSLKPTRRSLTS